MALKLPLARSCKVLCAELSEAAAGSLDVDEAAEAVGGLLSSLEPMGSLQDPRSDLDGFRSALAASLAPLLGYLTRTTSNEKEMRAQPFLQPAFLAAQVATTNATAALHRQRFLALYADHCEVLPVLLARDATA